MIFSACGMPAFATQLFAQVVPTVVEDAATKPAVATEEQVLIGSLVLALMVAGIVVWGFAISRWRRGQAAIKPVERRRVPWRGLEVGLVIGLLMLGAFVGGRAADTAADSMESSTTSAPDDPADRGEEMTADEFVKAAAVNAAIMLGLGGVVVALLVFARGASASDLGFAPIDAVDLARGAMTWVAVLVPVYALQAVLVQLIAEKERKTHPLIDMLGADHSVAVLVMAAFTAVIVAPLVEEFLFRVLLQGWLERVCTPPAPHEIQHAIAERHASGPLVAAELAPAYSTLRPDYQPPTTLTRAIDGQQAADIWTQGSDAIPADEAVPPIDSVSANASIAPVSSLGEPTSPSIADYFAPYTSPHADPAAIVEAPQVGGPPQFPSWRAIVPIVLSSAIFAAAHAGVWPDPVPLFVLALGLGYVYHQTHRIWPSILVHMLFNGFSIAMVWLNAT